MSLQRRLGTVGGGGVASLKAGDPSQVGGYRLLSRLGGGGMGQVFLGESRGGRKVAVKLIRPEYADDQDFRLRFAREVAAARKVGGFHTALVVDADPDADPPWMVTTYIPGPSLAEAVAERGPVPPAAVCELGAALAEGLAAIHDCDLIHRDLKPANVILAADGPRIIDFGIARSASATTITVTGATIGTVQYMSPEHLGAGEIGYESDIFSLGALLVFAATGRGPFDAAESSMVIGRILTQLPNLGGLTGSLREVIGACLAKEPAKRPTTDDLLAYFSKVKNPPAHPPAHPAATERDRRQPEDDQPGPASDHGRTATATSPSPAQRPALVAAAPPLDAHAADISLMSFSPDGRLLATAAVDWTICLWDTTTWRPVAPLISQDLPSDIFVRGFSQLAFTPDSRTLLATRAFESAIWRWDTRSGQLTGTPLRPEPWAAAGDRFSLAPLLSPDGRFGLSYQSENAVLLDISTGKSAVLPPAFRERIFFFKDASFSLDGGLVAVVDASQRVHLWKTGTRERAGVLRLPDGPRPDQGQRIRQVAISSDVAIVISDAGRDDSGHALHQWDLASGGQPVGPQRLDTGHVGRFTRLDLSPDGRTFATRAGRGPSAASSGEGFTVSVWDSAKRTRANLPAEVYETSKLAFSPDGRLLVTTTLGDLSLWDIGGAQPALVASRRTAHSGKLTDVAFSPVSRLLVATEGKLARVWRLPRP